MAQQFFMAGKYLWVRAAQQTQQDFIHQCLFRVGIDELIAAADMKRVFLGRQQCSTFRAQLVTRLMTCCNGVGIDHQPIGPGRTAGPTQKLILRLCGQCISRLNKNSMFHADFYSSPLIPFRKKDG